MLDYTFKQAERQAAAFMGQALAFNMNNGTDDGLTATGSSRGTAGDSITACLDSKRQKIVPIGEYYYADPCTLCLCSNAEFMCKQISCAPPEKCDGYIKKDPLHCCDVCVPAVVVEKPSDQSSLNMKLGALTVALFLVISLVLFTLHRMRRKRLLITLRRLQSFRHRDSVCSYAGDGSRDYRRSIDAAESGLFSTSPPRFPSAPERAAVIAEGPPPYHAAVTLPRAPESLARAPPRATAPAEPPPTYRQAVQQDLTTVRRCASQNGHRPPSAVIAGAGRHSRTSDYPDDDEEVEARSTTTYSSSTLSSSSSASSLSSSRNSLHLDEVNVDDDNDCCSCSQCDSGLSEERSSFSSNEVRPRSEALLTNSVSYHVVPGQPSTLQLLGDTMPHPQTSAAVEHREERRCRRSRPEASGGAVADNCNGGGARETKGKFCKKKLKKLMMKAKRKAKRGRRDEAEGSTANAATSNSSAITRSAAEEGECSRTSANGRSSHVHDHPRPDAGAVEAMPVTSL